MTSVLRELDSNQSGTRGPIRTARHFNVQPRGRTWRSSDRTRGSTWRRGGKNEKRDTGSSRRHLMSKITVPSQRKVGTDLSLAQPSLSDYDDTIQRVFGNQIRWMQDDKLRQTTPR